VKKYRFVDRRSDPARLPRRIARRLLANRRTVSAVSDGARFFVNDQRAPALAPLRFGKYPFSYNGCEVAAAYNAFLELGLDADLADLAAEFELNGLVGFVLFGKFSPFAGKWGADPRKLPRLFSAYGVGFRKIDGSPALRAAVESPAPGKRVFIASFLNRGFLLGGVHTFCFTVSDGVIRARNGYAPSPACFDSLAPNAKLFTAFELFTGNA